MNLTYIIRATWDTYVFHQLKRNLYVLYTSCADWVSCEKESDKTIQFAGSWRNCYITLFTTNKTEITINVKLHQNAVHQHRHRIPSLHFIFPPLCFGRRVGGRPTIFIFSSLIAFTFSKPDYYRTHFTLKTWMNIRYHVPLSYY